MILSETNMIRRIHLMYRNIYKLIFGIFLVCLGHTEGIALGESPSRASAKVLPLARTPNEYAEKVLRIALKSENPQALEEATKNLVADGMDQSRLAVLILKLEKENPFEFLLKAVHENRNINLALNNFIARNAKPSEEDLHSIRRAIIEKLKSVDYMDKVSIEKAYQSIQVLKNIRVGSDSVLDLVEVINKSNTSHNSLARSVASLTGEILIEIHQKTPLSEDQAAQILKVIRKFDNGYVHFLESTADLPIVQKEIVQYLSSNPDRITAFGSIREWEPIKEQVLWRALSKQDLHPSHISPLREMLENFAGHFYHAMAAAPDFVKGLNPQYKESSLHTLLHNPDFLLNNTASYRVTGVATALSKHNFNQVSSMDELNSVLSRESLEGAKSTKAVVQEKMQKEMERVKADYHLILGDTVKNRVRADPKTVLLGDINDVVAALRWMRIVGDNSLPSESIAQWIEYMPQKGKWSEAAVKSFETPFVNDLLRREAWLLLRQSDLPSPEAIRVIVKELHGADHKKVVESKEILQRWLKVDPKLATHPEIVLARKEGFLAGVLNLVSNNSDVGRVGARTTVGPQRPCVLYRLYHKIIGFRGD